MPFNLFRRKAQNHEKMAHLMMDMGAALQRNNVPLVMNILAGQSREMLEEMAELIEYALKFSGANLNKDFSPEALGMMAMAIRSELARR